MQIVELHRYLQQASDSDKLWAIAVLSGKKVHSSVSLNLLREFALELSGLDDWLFEECYARVGDLAETIALILPAPKQEKELTLTEIFHLIRETEASTVKEKQQTIVEVWNSMETFERFIFNKLLTTGLRLRLPRRVIAEALAHQTSTDHRIMAYRLSGAWNPRFSTFAELVLTAHPDEAMALPYPFCNVQKAKPDLDLATGIAGWIAEWKWEGIRVQLIKRNGHVFIWNYEEELITDKLPEPEAGLRSWPDGIVMDGQLIAFREAKPMPLSFLQQRIARKHSDRKSLEEIPVVFMAFDLLEYNGVDIRSESLAFRRNLLADLFRKFRGDSLMLSEALSFSTWSQLKNIAQSRPLPGTDGLIIKNSNSMYSSTADEAWLSWRPQQLSLDAVLIYAEAGPRSSAARYSHYTFALWNGDLLVPVAKSGIGLTGAEVQAIDAFVKSNTKEKFGPVRSVSAELVFEIGFDSVTRSTRHKSGVLLRMPRIIRWRTDKKAGEAHTLQDLIALIPG